MASSVTNNATEADDKLISTSHVEKIVETKKSKGRNNLRK